MTAKLSPHHTSVPAREPEYWLRYRENFVRNLLGVAREYKRAVMVRLKANDDYHMLRLSFEAVVTVLSTGAMRATDISGILGLSKQHTSQLIGEVARAGLVARNADPSDSRARLVALTPLGHRLVEDGLLAAIAVSRELTDSAGVAPMADALLGVARLSRALGLRAPAVDGRALPAEGVIGDDWMRLADYMQECLMQKCREQGFGDLKLSDGQVLAHLSLDGARMQRLARVNAISTQGVGRIVRDLEGRGYVQRRADHLDARSRRVWLTVRGYELIAASVRAVDDLRANFEGLIGSEVFIKLESALARLYGYPPSAEGGQLVAPVADRTAVPDLIKENPDMSQDLREKGIEMFNTVYCGDLPQPPEKGEDRFFDHMLETLFGSLWADSTLPIRDRRLILLGAIAAQGEDMTFVIQVRSALKRSELTVPQVQEILLFLTQYVGYPRASRMRMAVAQVLQEYASEHNGASE